MQQFVFLQYDNKLLVSKTINYELRHTMSEEYVQCTKADLQC